MYVSSPLLEIPNYFGPNKCQLADIQAAHEVD